MVDKVSELNLLADEMAASTTYDDAWMCGLELQTFGVQAIKAFRQVLEMGNLAARQAAAFWLSDEAEMVPAEVFFSMANDDDGEIRFHAAYSLAYIKDERTLKTLREMVTSDISEEVRQTAVQSLYAAAKLNEVVENILDDYAAILASDLSPKVREEVVTHLAHYVKSSKIKQVVAIVEKSMTDNTEMVREQAKISLSVLRNEQWEDEKVSSPL